jgi:hypothetical protein
MSARMIELLLLFGVAPVVFAASVHRLRYRGAMAPVLWLLSVGAGVLLVRDPGFDNVPAIALTAIGGALFLDTYLKTDSMLVAAAEHGAYGVTAFSAGLGKFLYLGAQGPRPRA